MWRESHTLIVVPPERPKFRGHDTGFGRLEWILRMASQTTKISIVSPEYLDVLDDTENEPDNNPTYGDQMTFTATVARSARAPGHRPGASSSMTARPTWARATRAAPASGA